MFDNLVTYHVHKCDPLPANNALAYQYILAGNGLFIRTETGFFEAILPIATCTVRGLEPLRHSFRLKVARIPARLLDTILTDARRARRPDSGLNEVLYQFHHHGQTVQVKKPAQHATGVAILAAGKPVVAFNRFINLRLEFIPGMAAYMPSEASAFNLLANMLYQTITDVQQREPDPRNKLILLTLLEMQAALGQALHQALTTMPAREETPYIEHDFIALGLQTRLAAASLGSEQ